MAFVLIGAGLMGLLAGTFTQYCDDHFPKIPKDKDTKRNLHLERQTSQPMLFAPRNLSNHEALYKLSGLKLSVTPWEDSSWEGAEDRILRGRVTGSKGQWNVLANITTSKSVHPRTAIDAGGGIQSGQLAFFHPDSNELVEGLWVTISPTLSNGRAHKLFQKNLEAVKAAERERRVLVLGGDDGRTGSLQRRGEQG